MKSALVVDLGLVEYGVAWDLQRRLVAARKADAIADVLLLCEHPHVITLGRNGKPTNLLTSGHVLSQMGVSFFETDRGGDITYHGPGQLVGYPILNLAAIRRDVGWYVRSLEESMIRATADLGVPSRRVPGRTGVWVDVLAASSRNTSPMMSEEISASVPSAIPPAAPLTAASDEEKLAAIGVHLSRWVTSHGFAYNVATDLRYFDLIVPCGIAGKRATSLEKILGARVEMKEVAARITGHLGELLDREFRLVSVDDLNTVLHTYEHRSALAAV